MIDQETFKEVADKISATIGGYSNITSDDIEKTISSSFKDVVSFETAKFLKSLGFVGKTTKAYYTKKDIRKMDGPFSWNTHYSFSCGWGGGKYDKIDIRKERYKPFYAAPNYITAINFVSEALNFSVKFGIGSEFFYFFKVYNSKGILVHEIYQPNVNDLLEHFWDWNIFVVD